MTDENEQRPSADPPGLQVLMTDTNGDPKSLQVHQVPRPGPGKGKVIVQVEAAGLSFAEVQMLRGLHPFPPRLPFVPGYDLVGRVVEVGPKVEGWAVNDRVVAMPRKGAWQHYVELPAKILARVPDGLDAGDAVALACNGVTAWQMLHRLARVRAGDTVLVHGASGGVGTLLTRLAVHHGARVIGTASPGKHAALRELGAEPVDYRADVAAAVRGLAPGGVAAAFDHIGGKGLDVGWNLLARGGTLVSYDSSVKGFAAGQWFRPHLPVLRKVAWWTIAHAIGATRGRRAKTFYVKSGPKFNQDIASLFALAEKGELRPQISARYPLAQADDALAELIAGRVVGKVILTA
jgi:NADPH2:quinone reductase